MRLLGVDMENISRETVFAKMRRFLDEPGFHQVATVNPEFLLEAERNPAFRKALASCELRVIDGTGIALVAFLRGERLRRYPGADLMNDILTLAEREGKRVFFAVNEGGLSSFSDVSRAVRKHFPGLAFTGADIDFGRTGGTGTDTGETEIVFCNAGAPKQEFFLAWLRGHTEHARLGIGVGGSFDFLTGKRRRAPEWMRTLGIEWLWRLGREPWRAKRIWKATIVFLWKTFTDKKSSR